MPGVEHPVSSASDDLTYTVSNHVATITLNRADRKNSFTLEMIDAWANALHTAEQDPNVRAVILTGTEDSFCAGVDLDVLAARERTPLNERNLLTQHVHRIALAADYLSKPYIAGVNGVAVGAGMDMSLMCDIRIAARSARFSEGYIRIGVVPGDGGCFYLPPIVGTATALRLLWTGEWVDADEALRIGLVSDVVDDADLLGHVHSLAATLAAQPPVAVQLIKRSVRSAARQDLRTALDLIASHQAVATSTDDSREALAAFTERRTARFTGR